MLSKHSSCIFRPTHLNTSYLGKANAENGEHLDKISETLFVSSYPLKRPSTNVVQKWLTCMTTSSPGTLKRSNHKTVKNKDLTSCAIYDRVPQVIVQPVTAHPCLPLWGLGRLPGSDEMPDNVLLHARYPQLRLANASLPRADERTRA